MVLMKLGRRSFFSQAALGAAAGAVVATRADAAPSVATPRQVLRTAVSVTFGARYDDNEECDASGDGGAREFEYPEGFIPVAVSVTTSDILQVRIHDEERVVLDIGSDAFKHGPLDFWHAPVGKLRVVAWTPHYCPSVAPLVTVVIHGEIDID